MQVIVDTNSSVPLFAQLVEQIKQAVQAEAVAPGDALPSIRQLATDLQVNSKTVAKAYSLLERDSVIQTKGYRGTFIHPDAKANSSVDLSAWVRDQLKQAVETLKGADVTDSEIRIGTTAQIQETNMLVQAIFYTVFVAQLLLISYYYPRKFTARISYLLANYPPEQYPKLYPKPYDYHAENSGRKSLRAYKIANGLILLAGFGILASMLASDYTPRLLGGDEVFVLMFGAVQMVPHMITEIGTAKYFKRMKEVDVSTTQKADLHPRRLFDFISPVYVGLAVILYIGWVVFHISSIEFEAGWTTANYITLIGISVVNLFMAAVIAFTIRGVKIDPHQAYRDQLKQIEMTVRICVFSNILMSSFLILMDASDRYQWEVFDPVFTSLYFQFIIVFGLGMRFRKSRVEDVDFSVYKEDAWLV